MLRESLQRRVGYRRLLLYVLCLVAVSVTLLTVSDRTAAYQMKQTVLRRLGAVQTAEVSKVSGCL